MRVMRGARYVAPAWPNEKRGAACAPLSFRWPGRFSAGGRLGGVRYALARRERFGRRPCAKQRLARPASVGTQSCGTLSACREFAQR
ncbi:hypothetical protein WS68_10355 [Burkholderia sp. TSV86]|nr:hypothetical protein WS68_10355 [Burkholderia sp. TSV86]